MSGGSTRTNPWGLGGFKGNGREGNVVPPSNKGVKMF